MPQKSNLLMICLDTFRADVAYSGALVHLNALFRRGATFKKAVSSAPLTPVSHASIFTGLQPYEHGLRHLMRNPIRTAKRTIAQVLADHGYETGAVVSCPGLNRWYGMDVGFDHYDDEVPRLPDGSDPLHLVDVKIRGTAMKRAPQVVERSLEWLSKHRDGPFFFFAHFFDTHYPYEAPQNFGPPGINPYEGEAHYVDHYLGRFVAQLDEWNLLDSTYLMVFSDHGEDLGGWYANDHAGEAGGHYEEEGHGCLLYDATQMVPLALIGPQQIPRGVCIEQQVRLVDLLPTALDLLRISEPEKRAGDSLKPLLEGHGGDRAAYFETYYREEQVKVPGLAPWRGVRLDKWKIIVDVSAGDIVVYDLEHDRLERNPISFPPRSWTPDMTSAWRAMSTVGK